MVVLLSAVVLSVFGLAILFVVAAAVYGIALVVGDGLVSLVSEARSRLVRTSRTPPRTVAPHDGSGAVPPELTTDALWHRMQGTSKQSRRKGISR